MAIDHVTTLNRTFRALGDSTRRQIVSMLATRGMQSASELGEPFNVAQPTISKHIKVLERARIVTRDVDGRTHRFRLNISELSVAEEWIARHRTFWEGALSQLGDLLDGADHAEDAE